VLIDIDNITYITSKSLRSKKESSIYFCKKSIKVFGIIIKGLDSGTFLVFNGIVERSDRIVVLSRQCWFGYIVGTFLLFKYS